MKRLLLAGLLTLITGAGCNNCEALEANICEDLGAEDCAYWKQGGGPDALSSGRRSGRACFNARFNPMQYDPYLIGAKAMAEAIKRSKPAAPTAQ